MTSSSADLENMTEGLHGYFMIFANKSLYTMREEPNLVLAPNILFWIVAVLGLFANLLLATVIIRNRRALLELPSNILLLNLALADILSLCVASGLRIGTYMTQKDLASVGMASKSDSAMTECEILLSNWTVTILAVLNFCGVFFPLKSKTLVTKRKMICTIILLWLIGLSLSIPVMYFNKPGDIMDEGAIANALIKDETVDANISYTIFLESVSNFPPLVVVTFLYPCIMIKIRRLKNVSIRNTSSRSKMNSSLRHISLIYFVFVLNVSFDFSATVLLYYFAFTSGLEKKLKGNQMFAFKFLTVVFDPFQIVHTMWNPFMHALLTENYRKYYIPMLCRRKQRDENLLSRNAVMRTRSKL